jgi:hypothetical protein
MVSWCNFIVSQLQCLMQLNGIDRRIKISDRLFPIKYLNSFVSVVYLNSFLNNVLVSFVNFFEFSLSFI